MRTLDLAEASRMVIRLFLNFFPLLAGSHSVATTADVPKEKNPIKIAVVSHPADYKVIEYPWGHLTWYASHELRNSDTMTVGEAVIKPGKENPRHFHPNCDEILHVTQGHILQSIGNKTVEMQAGDTVSIPAGLHHNAKNIGPQDAMLQISYSSADRQVVGE